MLEIIEFRRPTESCKNLYITSVPNGVDENELTVNVVVVVVVVVVLIEVIL